VIFRNQLTCIFYGEELLAPRPTPKLEDNPLSAVRDCLFNIFAVASISGGRLLHLQPEARHGVVTRAPPNMDRTSHEGN
jgi:hypothetical protein